MRKLIFAAACAPAIALGTTAHAASCDDGITALNDSLTTKYQDGAIERGVRSEMRDLMEAANKLDRAGYSDACESIVEAMKDMAENKEARRTYVMGENAMAGSEDRDSASREEMDAEKDREQAVKLSDYEGPLTVGELEDYDVHNMNGEDIGAVDEVLTTERGEATHLLIGHGGFLGIGDKDTAVPLDRARISTQSQTIYLDISEEQMDKMPDYDEIEYREDREAWVKQNDAALED